MRQGSSMKNARFIKRGLTKQEQETMSRKLSAIQEMWKSLYAKNKWKPQPDEKKTK